MAVILKVIPRFEENFLGLDNEMLEVRKILG
jgi:hypothetical protein